jgi:hypothetical protein
MPKKRNLDPNQRLILAYLKSESRRMNPLMVFSGFSWSATQKNLPESVGNAHRELNAIKEAEVLQAYAEEIIKDNRRSLPQIRNDYEDTKDNKELSKKEKYSRYIKLMSELERDYDLTNAFVFKPDTKELERTEIRLYNKIQSSFL